MSSNVFVTPRSITTIARGRIDHNTSLQALLQNFASNAQPVAESVNLEGSIGLQPGMLWYKSGTLSELGEGRLLVYDGSTFTRTGIAVHRMGNLTSANSAATSGFISRGDLVDVGDDRLYMVNSSGTAVFDVGTIPPTANVDAGTLGGVSLATLRNEYSANDLVTLGLARANDLATYTTLRAEYRANDGVTLGLALANDGVTLLSARANDYSTYLTLRSEYRANDHATWSGLNSFANLKANASSPSFTGAVTMPEYIVHADDVDTRFGFSDIDTFVIHTGGLDRITVTPSGNVGIGISSASSRLEVDGQVSAVDFNSTSDLTVKENILPIQNAVSRVMKIKGITFNFIGDNVKDRHAGVIAQDVEQVLPEAVRELSSGIKHVAYGNLIGLLVEAIKEQQLQINELRRVLKESEDGN